MRIFYNHEHIRNISASFILPFLQRDQSLSENKSSKVMKFTELKNVGTISRNPLFPWKTLETGFNLSFSDLK